MKTPQSPMDFSRQLIKGKIGEIVFDQMFRRTTRYTVIPFGYESIIPELTQYVVQADREDLIEHIRNAPDFALVLHDPKKVLLVEVKYRTTLRMDEMKEIAQRISDQWKLAWLFVATPEGFYFDLCTDVEGCDAMTSLSPQLVPTEIQQEYLRLIKEFIQGI